MEVQIFKLWLVETVTYKSLIHIARFPQEVLRAEILLSQNYRETHACLRWTPQDTSSRAQYRTPTKGKGKNPNGLPLGSFRTLSAKKDFEVIPSSSFVK